tara:strand:- start:1936 stop:2484 length:549 start_codon:yes stop_codon:yes gene_type:complete
MAKSNMHISRLKSIAADVQRTYNWEVIVQQPAGLSGDFWEDDTITLRARSAMIPGSTTNAIESTFMGMKQFFAGNSELEHTLNIEFEEFEDQKLGKLLNAWQRIIFDAQTDSGSGDTVSEKAAYCSPQFKLRMLKQDGEPMDEAIIFENAWLQNFASVQVSYGDSSSVKYSCSFQWDYYKLV